MPWFLVVDFEVSLMAKIERVFNIDVDMVKWDLKQVVKVQRSTFNSRSVFSVAMLAALKAGAMGVQCLY